MASSSRAAIPTVSGTGLTPRPIERNLKRTLLCELLIKLLRRKVSINALLQHVRAHRDFVDFVVVALGGVLRLDVYNLASTILQRVRVATLVEPTVTADTAYNVHRGGARTPRPCSHGASTLPPLPCGSTPLCVQPLPTVSQMKEFLDEQAKELTDKLKRSPCPRSPEGPEVFGRVADRERAFVSTFSTKAMAPMAELDRALTELCADYWEIIKHGFGQYVESARFDELLDRMGAYAEGVIGLINAASVSELSSQFDQLLPPAEGTEFHFVPLEATPPPPVRPPSAKPTGKGAASPEAADRHSKMKRQPSYQVRTSP